MKTEDRNFDLAFVGEKIAFFEGAKKGSDVVVIKTKSGRTFRMHHNQECYECVYVGHVSRALPDVIGKNILSTKEVRTQKDIDSGSETTSVFSFTTRAGTVDITWVGSSNGYYSESVSFVEVLEDN